MPLISTIVGVYSNKPEAAPLERAVRSVLGRSLSNFDLFIYDDGSDVPTERLLDRMAETDARIKLVWQEDTITLPQKFDLCLSHVTGRFIARVDGDNSPCPQRLERWYEYLVGYPETSFVDCSINRIFNTDTIIPAIFSRLP